MFKLNKSEEFTYIATLSFPYTTHQSQFFIYRNIWEYGGTNIRTPAGLLLPHLT